MRVSRIAGKIPRPEGSEYGFSAAYKGAVPVNREPIHKVSVQFLGLKMSVITPDDMNCNLASCQKDIFPTDVESFGIIYWNPKTETNELLAMACSMDHLLQLLDKERQ